MLKIFKLLSRKNTSTLLLYFLEHPTGKTYARQLRKEIQLSGVSILGGLRALLEAGILEVEEIGRVRRYELKRNEPVVKQLKVLLTINKVTPLLGKFRGSGVEVYLYGSAARGEDTEKSDIDIFIQGNETDVPTETLEKLIKRKINLMFETDICKLPNELKNNLANGIVLQGYFKVL